MLKQVGPPDKSSRLVDLNFDPPLSQCTGVQSGDACCGFRIRRQIQTAGGIDIGCARVGRHRSASAYVTDGDIRDNVYFAAGITICEAAGCTVTDLRGRVGGRSATGLVEGMSHSLLS